MSIQITVRLNEEERDLLEYLKYCLENPMTYSGVMRKALYLLYEEEVLG